MKVEFIDTRKKPVDNGFRGFMLIITNDEGEIDREFFAPAERLRAETRHAEELTKAGRSRQRELVFDVDQEADMTPGQSYPDWARIASAEEAPKPSKAELRRDASIKRKADREALAKLSTSNRVWDTDLFTCQLTHYPEVTFHFEDDVPTIVVYIPGMAGGRLRLSVMMAGDAYADVWELAMDYLYKYSKEKPGRRQPPPPESQWELLAMELELDDGVTDALYPAMRNKRDP